MKITSLKELIDRGEIEGATIAGVDYLMQTSNAFIELVKKDGVLALKYAKVFNLEHIEQIAQVNIKLFTSLYALTHDPLVKTVALTKVPLGLNAENQPSTLNAYSNSTNTDGSAALYLKFN